MVKNKKISIISQLTLMVFMAYVSLLLLWGIVVGYLTAKYFHKKLFSGKNLHLRIGGYKLHIHHWIMGLVSLFVYFWVSRAYDLRSQIFDWHFFIAGTLGGIAFEDFWCDKKWYKVLYRNLTSK